MESYEESVRIWRNYLISNAEYVTSLGKSYRDSYLKMSYDFLLKREAELIKKICEGKTTFVRVFSVYYYLLWNGFFSVDRCFKYGRPNSSLNYKEGTAVSGGKGVCFNIASHFRDVLNYITDDYSCFLIGMHAEGNDVWEPTNPLIKIQSSSIMVEGNPKTLLNHVNVLVMTRDGDYILDPTNFLIYEIKKVNSNNSNLTRVELRINIDLDFSYEDIDELKKILDKFTKFNDAFASREYKRCIDESLDIIYNGGIKLCNNHMDEILKFREEYDVIYNQLASNMPVLINQVETKAKSRKNGRN